MINPFKKTGGVDFLVVGLGNPGREYENTRHNAGFITLNRLSEKYSIDVSRLKYHALTGTGTINGKKVMLMKPQTFMNKSGEAVREAMNFYKLSPSDVVIISDDISLEPGRLRIRRKGSDGGQKGLRSIFTLCGSSEFPRIKMGVGSKPEFFDLADWVLSKFSKDEMTDFSAAAESACDAVSLIIGGDIDKAMNLYNSKIR